MRSEFSLSYKKLGDSTLLIQWPGGINKDILREIIRFQQAIEYKRPEGLIETWTSYNSLCIAFDPDKTSFVQLTAHVQELNPQNIHPDKYRWHIPVCYGGEQGRDLETVAKELKMSPETVIALHTASVYTVYFLGFLPGFLYLGELDDKLHLPRKANPDRSVPRGSVAIGGGQTGIYPVESPGGWHVIGTTPVSFFDPGSTPPCVVSPGDELVFEKTDIETFRLIELEVSAGTYRLKKEKLHG